MIRGKSPARSVLIIAVTIAAALIAIPAGAQTLYGNIVGIVKDSQGLVLPGANVVIVNTGTNLKREGVTDAQGAFTFVNVLAGQYDVRISLQGFREAVRTGVPVTVGQVSRVETTLEIGGMNETVTVKSEAELLQTDKADTRTELNSQEVTSLPLNGYRNVQSLIVLVPGSLPPTFQNAETDTPQRSLFMTVNGLSGVSNTTRTDGSRNVNVEMPYHLLLVPSAETVDTVNITTGSMDAEEGMAVGASITVTTKSGTNNFHGSAFEFFNNQKLNAAPYYFGRGAVPAKPIVKRQTAGGTLGGPVLRNRVFFFGSYEGYYSDANQYVFYTVPDAALRNGDFSNALNANGTLQRIYDPFTGDMTTGNGRLQFDNNRIPADRVNSIGKNLLAMYPLPNIEGSGAGNLTNNYRALELDTTRRHNFDMKFNWNRTGAHQIWVKYSGMRALVNNLFHFPLGRCSDCGGDTNVDQITAGQTWSLSPTLLLDSSFGTTIDHAFSSAADFNLGNMGLALGIPGTNDQGRGDYHYAGLPSFATGFTTLGNSPTWTPQWINVPTVSFSTSATKISGRHEFKTGYFLDYLGVNSWEPEIANPRGSFTFAMNATRTFGTGAQTANFYNQYAAFLLGLVGTAGKSIQYENFTAYDWQHAVYARDRWTPTKNLTLDLGLRWEYYPIMQRANRQIEMLDLTTLNVLIGGVGGNPKNMGLTAPKNDFAPRAGVVYRLNEKTVVRAGYGLTYDGRSWGAIETLRGQSSYPLALNGTYQTPAAQANFGWYAPLNEGIPLLNGPDLSKGSIPLPNTVGMTTAVPASTQRGKTHSWNVALERRLPFVSVDAAYVGNRQVDGLTNAINVNNVQHLGGGATDRPYFPTNGRQLAINIFTPYTRTEYNGLQIGITRPLTHGLLLKGHYTFASAWSLGTSYQLPDADAQDRNWSEQSTNRPHTFTMGFVYQVPEMTSTEFSLLRALANNWQLNGVFQAFSGTPFTVTADATTLNTPNNTQTANLVGPVTKVGKIGADGVYYDPLAWEQPTCVCFGSSRLNQFRGPGGWNLDFSVFRTFPLANKQKAEVRVEGTNMTNTPKFANPTAAITSGDFMHIYGLNTAFAQRQIRLAIRYSF
jgi:hypothetical protein